MRRTVIPLILIFLSVASPRATAQQKPQDQKTTAATASDTDQPKNEVEEMLAEAKKKGEVILGTCIENCGDNPETIKEGFERGRVVALSRPAYPALARKAHVQGTVGIQIIIDEDGKVIRAAAVSGHPLLYPVCLEAARNSQFTGSKLDGKPVKVVGVVQYNFVAQ